MLQGILLSIIHYQCFVCQSITENEGGNPCWVAAASDTVAVGQCNWRNPRFESSLPNFLLSLSRSHRHSLPTPFSPAIMPTCRRKRVVLTEPSEALLQLVKTNPNKEVYFMQQTGEIFESYEYDCLSMSNTSAVLTRRVHS